MRTWTLLGLGFTLLGAAARAETVEVAIDVGAQAREQRFALSTGLGAIVLSPSVELEARVAKALTVSVCVQYLYAWFPGGEGGNLPASGGFMADAGARYYFGGRALDGFFADGHLQLFARPAEAGGLAALGLGAMAGYSHVFANHFFASGGLGAALAYDVADNHSFWIPLGGRLGVNPEVRMALGVAF